MFRPLTSLFLLAVLRSSAAQRAAAEAYNEVWLTPTPETSADFYVGGMPVGNGDTQVLAWANATAGGVSIYVSKQNALASDSSNYKLGLLTLSLTPNPFSFGGTYFNQTLDIASGTVVLRVGGTPGAPAAAFTVWVDATSNTAYVTATAGATPFTFEAQLTPVRPDGYAPYVAPWHCTQTSAAPDVVVDPLPPSTPPFPSPSTLVLLHENLASDRAVPLITSTLTTQHLAGAIGTVPDVIAGRRSGVAVDAVGAGSGCAAFQRTSPLTLTSTAPAACATVRITTRSTQAEADRDAWVDALAAQVADAPPAPPRAAHEAWWQAFWGSTWVDIESSVSTAASGLPTALPPTPLLWLRASDLSLPNGSAVAAWGGPGGTLLAQANVSHRPVYVADAFRPGLPGVRFSQHQLTYLSSPTFTLPAGDVTILVVLKDQGSNGGDADPASVGCCSGVVSFPGTFLGVSTFPSPPSGVADDDAMGPSDDPLPNGVGISVLGDFSGSNLASGASVNAAGRSVVVAVVYAGGTATLYVDGCAQGSAQVQGNQPASVGLFVGTRGADKYERFFEGLLGEAVIYARALAPAELRNATAFLSSAYAVPTATVQCVSSDGFKVAQTYAMSRYMNAAQSRVVALGGGRDQQPIKFNGLAWTSERPGTGAAGSGPGCPAGLGPDCREWGPSNWWQNVRLGYHPMVADGDWAQLDVLLTYYLRSAPFLRARAQALLPGAAAFPDMLWQTETSTIFGSFTEVDWAGDSSHACSADARPADLPPWLQNTPYLYLDAFGDGPTGELGLLILDAFLYDGNATALASRLPWVLGALDYFSYKFFNGSVVRIAPTQACETLWSPWPITNTSERVEGDAPTIAVVTRLLERALAEVPPALLPADRAQAYAAVLAAMPPLPVGGPNGTLLAPAIFTNGATHNSESVALYSVHPTRHFSVGRLLTGGVASLAPAVATFFADPNAGGSPAGNNGWHQAPMHAPLLGLRNETAALLVGRTVGRPLPGYRFPFFSGEEGMSDEPAVEFFSNLQAGVQFALLQAGEGGAVVAFPSWPCDWDVHFRLRAPLDTTVEGVWRGGALVNLTVLPASRAGAVIVAAGC